MLLLDAKTIVCELLRGTTQTELAERSGVPQPVISSIKTGALKNPGWKTMEKLMGARGWTCVPYGKHRVSVDITHAPSINEEEIEGIDAGEFKIITNALMTKIASGKTCEIKGEDDDMLLLGHIVKK